MTPQTLRLARFHGIILGILSSAKLTETDHAWTKRTDYCWRGLGKAGVVRSQNHVQVVSSTEAPDVLSNDSEKPGKASETRTVLGKLHAAGKSPEITCENAGNPGKIAADTRNSVGDATGKALSAAEITCETAGKSVKGKSVKSEADSRVNSVEEATETDARSALPISKSSSKLTETDHALTKTTNYND